MGRAGMGGSEGMGGTGTAWLGAGFGALCLATWLLADFREAEERTVDTSQHTQGMERAAVASPIPSRNPAHS